MTSRCTLFTVTRQLARSVSLGSLLANVVPAAAGARKKATARERTEFIMSVRVGHFSLYHNLSALDALIMYVHRTVRGEKRNGVARQLALG